MEGHNAMKCVVLALIYDSVVFTHSLLRDTMNLRT